MNFSAASCSEPLRRKSAALQCLVADALFRSGYATLTFVDYDVLEDRVVLHGRVASYHLKQVAQALVQRVPGVSRVDNLLVVQRHNEALRSTDAERHDAGPELQQN
jgi:osmotically-inducible protein OsmY